MDSGRFRRGLATVLFVLVALPAFARESKREVNDHDDQDPTHDPIHHVHGSHSECPLPKSPMDVVRCARERHPDVRRATFSAEASQTLTDVAGQLPNPELDVQSLFGKTLGDNQVQTQVALTVPIGLGGKRSARIRGAEAEQKQVAADQKEVEAEVTLKTVTYLHRLRQLEQEKAILVEAISAYAKLVAQYRGRPRLAPEQEVSLTVFDMALAENRIRRAAVLEEEREIGHFFHIATGHGLEELKSVLPPAPRSWPDIAPRTQAASPSPGLFRLMADQELALSQQALARAETWPTVQVGPMAQFQVDGALRSQLFGFQLVLDLPVLSLNGGSRAHAARAVAKADNSLALLTSVESHVRAEQVRVYENAKQALSEAGTSADVERKHTRVEQLAVRGLISSSLVIEAHRGRSELEKSRNERELRAIQALWTVYKLDGRIFEETL